MNGFSTRKHEAFVEVRAFPNVWSAPGREPGGSAAMTQPRSFEAVYAEYASFVWRIVRGMGVGEQQVQDAVQEVFMVVHRRLPEFDHRFAVKTWLFEIAYRVSCNARRKAARRHEALSEDLHEASPTPEEATDRRRAARVLQELLDQMPDERRLMLVFADLEGLTAPEIAELTGLPLNTVYSRIRRARQELSDALATRGWRRT